MVNNTKHECVLDVLHILIHTTTPGDLAPGEEMRLKCREVFSRDEMSILRLLIENGEMALEDLSSPIGIACLNELKLIEPVRRSRRGPSGEMIVKTHLTLTRRGVILSQFLNPR